MNTDENEKIELNVPASCPKCGRGVFPWMSVVRPLALPFLRPDADSEDRDSQDRNE